MDAKSAALDCLSRSGFVRRREEQSLVQRHTERLLVRTPSFESPIDGLSGGNQQKLALAKWLARECNILIVDEPTRGVDVGAKAEIHRLLDELAGQGLAVLLISSELPEVMNLSRRMLVMREGKLVGELEREDYSQANLMQLMVGIETAAGQPAGSGPRTTQSPRIKTRKAGVPGGILSGFKKLLSKVHWRVGGL